VVAGELSSPAAREMLRAIRGRFLPQRVVAFASRDADVELMPILDGKTAPASGARAYVCRNYACKEPADDVETLARQLGD
jgi:uncharacterized protein YyaL (SSP411 family)